MAEIATGAGIALAAEEILSTTVQAGVATYFLAKPTQPLTATFTRIAVAHDDDLHQRSLTRSHHTLTIVNDKAYIFGGETAQGELANNDLHVINLAPEVNKDPEYQLIPALPESGDGVPVSRTKHAACAFQNKVAIHGGQSLSGQTVDPGTIWLFNPDKKTWESIYSPPDTTPSSNDDATEESRIFPHEDSLILCTGKTNSGITALHKYTLPKANAPAKPWPILLPPPNTASPSNVALYDSHLYFISSSDPMSSQLHILPLSSSTQNDDPKWTTLTFPTNPLIPGPRARHGGALLPVSTGYGRNYLAYFFGARDAQGPSSSPQHESNFTEQDLSSLTEDDTTTTTTTNPTTKSADTPEPTQWSDTWILQLPSSNLSPQAKPSLAEAIKPAKIKDAIRSAFGADSGKWSWAEVQVKVPDDLGPAAQGKLHPGPRAFFGADVMRDGKRIVFWGGEDAQGDKVGDGWIVQLE